uniref:DM2 domain-containing protein n=1 Tax=Salix viminalis TaxID=40686 RepID=A0A6N2NIJ9_SALVM
MSFAASRGTLGSGQIRHRFQNHRNKDLRSELEAEDKGKATSTTPGAPRGILKPNPVSPVLGDFLGGVPESSRADAVKKIWAHIKLHNLQNPTNKKEIICDAKLKVLFDGRDKVGFLDIGKLLSAHFPKTS